VEVTIALGLISYALLALVGWIYLLVTTDRTLLGYGALALLAGSVVFIGWSWKARSWPFARLSTPD